MPRFVDLRRLAVSFVLLGSFLGALASEVSAAERVETTPGLAPDAVRRVFEGQRQALAGCLRLVAESKQAGSPARSVPWNASADADDRLLLRFTVDANGKVAKLNSYQSTMDVRGAFIEPSCARALAEQWTFPPPVGEQSVEVSVWARFRSTEAERKAALARIHESFATLCQAVASAIPGDARPTKEVWDAALARILSEHGPRLDTRVRRTLDAVMGVSVANASNILLESMDSLATDVACPKVRAWSRF
ncbi:hypothetical protein LY474_33695 [Myxococcus stipitatus]|uniref:hypothetical protein n=1 Tax=Myxococcus stipitatus TaxID=83455 RepID=UPI001F2E6613|nr:hypothetical protein [Myxococcus stipitatus]MCE9672771.1 hypothetical protein [Myxococcus stipitatus]